MYEEKRARPGVGAARWTSSSPRCSIAARRIKLQGSERGVHRIPRRSRSPTSRRRCSSSTSWRRYGDGGLHKLLRAYGQGLDTDAALKAALDTDFDQLQAGFDQAIERRFGSLRRALAAARRTTICRRMPLDDAAAYAAAASRQLPACRWRSAARCARREQLDEAMQAFERAAALVPIARRRRQPARADGRASPSSTRIGARAIAELQALVGRRLRQRRRGAPARRRCCARPASPIRRRSAGLRSASSPSIRSTPTRTRARPPRDAARTTPTPPSREFRAVIALGPVDRAAALHRSRRELLQGAARRAEAKKQTLAALEIAPSYERAQTLLLKLVDNRP